MEKRFILVLTVLLFCLPITLAASNITITLSSPDDGYSSTSDSISFECSANDATHDITNIYLYTNTTGTWEVNKSGTGDTLSVTVTNIANGNYVWNCKAVNNISEENFGDNRTFTVSVTTNYAPNFTGTIPNVTFNEDSTNNSLFDLDDYFQDVQSLSYTVSGNSSVKVTIDSDNVVSFSAAANWSGTETIYFIANDGELTNRSNNILVNVTPVNDAPYYSVIPDLNWSKNTEKELNLDNYFHDVEGDTLTYNYTSKPEHMNVTFNDGVVTFSPEQDWTGSVTIRFIANDSESTTQSNTITLTVYSPDSENNAPSVSCLGTGKDILDVNEEREYKITKSDPDGDSLTVKWYLDNNEISGATSDSYKFSQENAGEYTLKAEVNDGTTSSSCSWTITVQKAIEEKTDSNANNNDVNYESIIKEQTETSECGDGIIDETENCENCPEDVVCGENEDCVDKVCVPKKPSKTKLILTIIIISLIISGASFTAYLFTTKRRKVYRDFAKAETLNKVKKEKPASDIHDFYYKNDNKIKKLKEIPVPKKKESPLEHYVRLMRENGYDDDEIRSRLKDNGWTDDDIKKVL